VTPAAAIWDRQRAIGRQLGAWAAASIAAGVALILAGGPFGRAVGIQFVVWGAVDLAIAALGDRDRRRKLARGAADDPAAAAAETRRLRRLLWINAGLDVVYLAVGAALVGLGRSPVLDGHGVGVLAQGGFLLLFDALHAASLPRPDDRR
jgi:hypothetical protein